MVPVSCINVFVYDLDDVCMVLSLVCLYDS